MQVDIDLKCMETNFVGCGHFGFGDFAPFCLIVNEFFIVVYCYIADCKSGPNCWQKCVEEIHALYVLLVLV